MSTPSSSNLTRGYAVAAVSAAILSLTAILIRYLTDEFHLLPLALAFWRDGFVALTLLPILALLRPRLLRVTRPQLVYLALYGLLLAVFNSLWTLSVALNGAAVSTVLAYSSAAFTALLAWWLLKEHLDGAKLLAVGLSLAGCVLVAEAFDPAAWAANPLGILTGVFSGLLYAGYSLMGRSASQRGLNPWTTIFYIFSFAALFLLLFNLVPGDLLPGAAAGQTAELFRLGGSLPGWGVLLLLAAGPSLAGYGLYNVSLSMLPSSVANLILTTEPVFTAVIAYFVFGETFNLAQTGGSLLILSGVVFLRISEGRRSAAASPGQA